MSQVHEKKGLGLNLPKKEQQCHKRRERKKVHRTMQNAGQKCKWSINARQTAELENMSVYHYLFADENEVKISQ